MIFHTVLLEPNPEVTEARVLEALQNVSTMQGKIGGINNISTGKNLSSYNKGYTYGFVIEFENFEYFSQYASHPAHQPISQELQSICRGIIDFDLKQE